MTNSPISAASPITIGIGIDDNCAILSARRIELNGQKYAQFTVVNTEGIQFSIQRRRYSGRD